jgi:hypothetical protein
MHGLLKGTWSSVDFQFQMGGHGTLRRLHVATCNMPSWQGDSVHFILCIWCNNVKSGYFSQVIQKTVNHPDPGPSLNESRAQGLHPGDSFSHQPPVLKSSILQLFQLCAQCSTHNAHIHQEEVKSFAPHWAPVS